MSVAAWLLSIGPRGQRRRLCREREFWEEMRHASVEAMLTVARSRSRL